jgi:hypothetical protein
MNSVKIGTYQMDTAFGLYLPEYTIPAPSPQTKFVKIIGRDGSVDLSDAIGLHYDSRSWSLEFKCFDPTLNWHTLTSSVMNAIHGKRLNFEFDDDPDYFWTGRISVSSYVSLRGTGTLKVNITSDPYKYKKLSTIVTKTASTGTDYTGSMVTFNTSNAQIYDLSSAINPTQDLHGYANPWPGGGNVNVWEPMDRVVNGITFTPQEDGTVAISGTTTAAGWTYVAEYVDLPYFGISAGDTITIYSDLYGLIYAYNGSTSLGSKASTGTAATYTIPSTATRLRFVQYATTSSPSAGQVVNAVAKYFLAKGSSFSTWTPYANICPISGLTGLSVYVSPTQDHDDATVYNVDWSTQAGTVYHGTVDPVVGQLTVDMVNIPSYNGETINEPWLSSMDAYAAGTTPTIGAQVVYTLATPQTYQLTPTQIEALTGANNVWSNSGNVTLTVVTPETVTNNGSPAVPTVTASADMVLKWGNYSASVQQGTSTIPQLVLQNGANLIYIIGTGTVSFEWSEASL